MQLDETFSLITKVFTNSINNFTKLRIDNELDWERQLYIEFRTELGEKIFDDYIIYLEPRVSKYGNNILWIGPNKYNKKKDIINEYFNIEIDKGGHTKVELDNSKKALSPIIKSIIDAEKKRTYYTDIVIYDNSRKQALAYIELKLKNNLTKESVLEDYYKLKRVEETKDFDAIYIAVGYDPLNNKTYWLPTDSSYNYNLKLKNERTVRIRKTLNTSSLSPEKIISVIKIVTKNLYENIRLYGTEALWEGEIMYWLEEYLPTEWRINSEIQIKGSIPGRIDLGIYNADSNLIYAIEIKGHYEAPFPREILNNLNTDKKIENDFLNQAERFFDKFNYDSSIKKTLSAYPKLNSADFINSDFFDKIIEMYSQCKRLSDLVKSSKVKRSFMFFVDHNDDYSLRKKTHSIPEEKFIENFRFRKKLIEKLLASVKSKDCDFIYFYKLNYKGNKQKVFLIDD